eukprot:tig00000760_g3940.t1
MAAAEAAEPWPAAGELRIPLAAENSVHAIGPSVAPHADETNASSSPVDEETLSYVPGSFLAQRSSFGLLAALQADAEARSGGASCYGIALFCDMSGFSRLAASLARQDKAHSAEKLSQTLNGFLARLVAQLHSRGLEPLVFAGDAVIAFRPAAAEDGPAMREAAAAALEAALASRAFRMESNGCPLATHCGVGVGELRTLAARGGEGALQLLHGGEAMRQCCEAAAASGAGEVVLSAEFGPSSRASPPSPSRALLASSASSLRPRPPPRRPPARRPRAPLRVRGAGGGGPGGGGARAAGAGRDAAGAGAGAGAGGGHGPYGEIRPVFVAFLSFPELDAAAPAPAAADAAARFGQIVRSLHRAAAEWGACVNKVFLDEKGCSALLCWGLAGGYAHEDDAERAVRAAAALEEWFEEAAAPFAAGVAGGRAFCGPLGAPCRREFAVIGDAALLCHASVVDAVAARGRRAALPFAELPPILAKGFDKPVPVFRPLRGPDPEGGPTAAAPPRSRPRSLQFPEPEAPLSPGPLSGGARRGGVGCLGRAAELERALRAVAAAAAGAGGTVLLEGEAGYGKSALLHELARECAGRGFAVLRAGAEAVEESTPLWALRGLVASATSAASEAAFEAGLAGLLPPKTPRSCPGLALVGVGRLARVAACLAALVEGLAGSGPRARPVALALEDAHWLDSASWLVLRSLREASPRLLLLVTSRPMPEPPRDFLLLAGRLRLGSDSEDGDGDDFDALDTASTPAPPAAAVSAAWGPEPPAKAAPPAPAVVDVRLGPLERGAARELLERLSGRLGVEWAPAALERVLDKAAGVPLYLVELVRAAAGDAAGRSPHSAGLPDSLQQIVLSRVDQLPAAARDLIKIAAVIDTGFTPAAVAAVAGPERDPAALRDAFRALADARLITESGSSSLAGAAAPSEAATTAADAGDDEEAEDEGAAWPGEEAPFVFSHALVREAVLSSLTAPHRRNVHRLFAEFLEARPVAAADPALLALHWEAGGEPERALRHLERAARRAHDAGALPEAARLYARLVALLDSLGLAGPPAAETARWRSSRTIALKNLCYVEARRLRLHCRAAPLTAAGRAWGQYYLGHAELALGLCLATLASAGAEQPRSELGPAALLRFVARAVPLAWPEGEAERVALIEVYVIVGWVAMKMTASSPPAPAKGGAGGGGRRPRSSALALTATGAVIALGYARGCALEHWQFGRGQAWFAVLLFVAGLRRKSAEFTARAEALAERHDSDSVREAAHSAGGYIEATAGRFARALERYEAACVLDLKLSSLHYVDGATYCAYVRLLLGRFGEAEERARGLEAYLHRTGGADYAREIVAMVAGYSALFTGRDAEAGRLLGRLEARGGAASFWTTTVAAVLRGLHAWRARGEAGAMAAAAAGLERILEREPGSLMWIHLLPLACALDFALWRAANARRRAGAAAGAGRPAPGGLWRAGRRVGDAAAEAARVEAAAAEGALRRLAGGMRALQRKSLPCLAPFCALARAEEPGLAARRRAELLRGAAEALEAAELRPFHAVARLRLALAEAAAGAAGPAAAALQRAERAARECGLRLPALERALAEGSAAAPAPRPYAFASMFV